MKIGALLYWTVYIEGNCYLFSDCFSNQLEFIANPLYDEIQYNKTLYIANWNETNP